MSIPQRTTKPSSPSAGPGELFRPSSTGSRSPFARWGRFTYRHRRAVLVWALVLLVGAGVWGTSVFGSLSGGGFEDPGSESTRAASLVEDTFGHVAADVVVLYSVEPGSGSTIDAPGVRAAITGALASVPASAVVSSADYYSTGSPGLVSADRTATYAVLTLTGDDDTAREETYAEIADDLVAQGAVTTLRGGFVPVSQATNAQVEADIVRAETLSIPVLMILLVVVFGSFAAAGLPLAIGVIAILGAFTVLKVMTLFTDVSIFAVNIVTILGLGLAIDYALFVVARFREELAAGRSVPDAVEVTVATAGRTVAFSGLIVGVSLGALLLFPMNFLRSMGYGGIAAVAVAMLAALTVLPALLGVLGHKVDALKVPFLNRRRRESNPDPDQGGWAWVARNVMRRPLVVVMVTAAVLVVLGLPFLRVAFGGVDARVLPPGSEPRVASEALADQFPNASAVPIEVVVDGASPEALETYRAALADLPAATGASVRAAEGDVAVIDVAFAGESATDEARALVEVVRGTAAPDGAVVLVGGATAALNDLLDGLAERLPWAALYLVLVTFALLFLAFGSFVLPIKAIAMNLLSLTATFGVLVWGFQNGALEGVLGFTSTGYLEATQPVLIFALAFGLAMDYEVFLLSRIREEWDRTGDNALAVSRGLQRSGRIITSAALLFVVVVGAFATSGIVFIQMIGVGLALAVILDATVVRALLVPATMKLLGRWNWWAPAPALRLWERIGFREGESGQEPNPQIGPGLGRQEDLVRAP